LIGVVAASRPASSPAAAACSASRSLAIQGSWSEREPDQSAGEDLTDVAGG
jgi:hypothetical protein